MATTKHARSESPASEPGSAKRSRPSLALLWTLPQEIRDSIWSLVCARPPSDEDESSASASTSGNGLAWRVNLDLPMVASLTVVSRHFYSLFNPMLWRHVRLTRPSTLIQFHNALESRPSNGALVRSLHVGELEDLAEGWWPCWCEINPNDPNEGVVHLKTSLTSRDEALGLLPRWCQPEQSWTYEEPPFDCHDRAIFEAIDLACAGMQVHTFYNGVEFVDDGFQPININAYTIGLFRVQAVLDLYLGEMRRRDDATKPYVEPWQSRNSRPRRKGRLICREGNCGHYPDLRLAWLEDDEEGQDEEASDAANSPQAAGTISKSDAINDEGKGKGRSKVDDDFTVTVAQVEAHLFRPGGFIDHFDHPLRFALAGLRALAVDRDEHVIVDHHFEQAQDYYSDVDSPPDSDEGDGGVEDGSNASDDGDSGGLADVASQNVQQQSDSEVDAGQLSEAYSSSSSADIAPFDGSSSSSTSWETTSLSHFISSSTSLTCDPNDRNGMVAIALATLHLLPNLKNLSLTGIFHCCLGIGKELPFTKSLNHLSIGPLSPLTDMVFCIDELAMPYLDKLRICGDFASTTTISHVSGQDDVMPRLREVVWDMGRTSLLYPKDVRYVCEALFALQGRRLDDGPSQLQYEEDQLELPYQAQEIPDSRRGRRFDVLLHPLFFAAVLEAAPSPEVREAWLQGLSTDNDPHAVRVLESRAEVMDDPEDCDPVKRRKDLAVFRKESQQWWEARALELEQQGE